MLNVSNEYAQAILSDSRDMPYRVSINGVTLNQDNIPNMTLSESVSGTSGLALGTANAAELTLTLREPMLTNYNGMLVEPESGLVLPDGSTEWISLGKFWVTKTTTSNNYKTVKLTCIDGMYHLSGNYETALEYPAPIRAVVDEIISQAGVDFIEPAVWPDLIVRVKPEKMTLRNAVGYIAGCFGCNARFNRSGQLEFVWYQDTGITVELEQQYLDGLTKLHDKPLTVSFDVTGAKEKYECIIVCGENGDVTATPGNNILEGDTVALAVRPEHKYMLATITAVDANGAAVRLTEDAEGAGYTFIQPDSNVTVTASFKLSNEGPFQLTCRSSGNGGITYAESDLNHEEGFNYFDAGEEVTLILTPGSGFQVDGFTTAPAGISVIESGADQYGNPLYTFVMPDSDTTITVHYREETAYAIERIVDYQGSPTSPGVILITNETAGGYAYHEGDIITVGFWATQGHEFDRCESTVELTRVNETEYRFTMPAYDVSITAYFKEQSDPAKEGIYSFLQNPSLAQPPISKPYWAVFYKYSQSVSPNAKYYLVWFDSWSESYGTITMNGYYYCQGANNGRSYHRWDTSVWSGNGSDGSTLKWESILGARNEDDYGLLASNVNLYRNMSTLMFQKCDTAIGTTQCDWYATGTDIREAGALDNYPCPDTYSTPLPRANWLMLEYAQVYVPNEEGVLTDFTEVYDGTGTYALFFDSVSVESVGKHFSNSDDEFFKLTFPGVTIVSLYSSGKFSSSAWTKDETCYILVRDPAIGSSASTAIGGFGESTCGLLASSRDILSGGLGFYNNKHIVCDCVHVASTFKLRRGVASDPVTLTYTNPMIYEKMVPAISEVVQGFTYTPARLKHRGNPAFQAGDIITCPDNEGVYHTVLIQQQTLTFGGGMNSEVSCPGETSETASFTSASPVSTQIREEVNKSYSSLEHQLSVNNSASFSAIYRAMASMRNTLQSLIDTHGDEMYVAFEELAGIDTRLSLAERDLTDLANRSITYETDLTYLEKDLANVKAEISILEREISNNQLDIETINTELDALTAIVDALSADLDALLGDTDRITETEERLDAIDTSITDLKTKVRAVETAVEDEAAARNEAIAAVRQVPEGGEAGQVLTQTDTGPQWCTVEEKKTAGLNFSQWDEGQFTEIVDGDETEHVYSVEFDEEGRPVKITDEGGHEMSITW